MSVSLPNSANYSEKHNQNVCIVDNRETDSVVMLVCMYDTKRKNIPKTIGMEPDLPNFGPDYPCKNDYEFIGPGCERLVKTPKCCLHMYTKMPDIDVCEFITTFYPTKKMSRLDVKKTLSEYTKHQKKKRNRELHKFMMRYNRDRHKRMKEYKEKE